MAVAHADQDDVSSIDSNSQDGWPTISPSAFPSLAALLWTVRETLESVLYRLVVVRLIVTDGSPRWLPRADTELQSALTGLRATEVLRAAEVEALISQARPPVHSSLAALTGAAPEPWPGIFADHRDALRVLVNEIDAGAADTKQVLHAALGRHRMPTKFASRPTRGEAAVTAIAAYRATLATVERVPQLSLHEFVD